jgi:hypothetical protein
MFWFFFQIKIETDDQYNHLAQLNGKFGYNNANKNNK